MAERNIIYGGAASRWFEPGEVYVIKDVTGQDRGYEHKVQMFKIGFSRDPNKRLKEIRKDIPNCIILCTFPAVEGNGAETAAQNAVKEKLGFVKDNGPGARGNATDWFRNPKQKNHQEILETVRDAVVNYNMTRNYTGDHPR